MLVRNPGKEEARVKLSFMTLAGPKPGPKGTLAPGTRQTWKANDFVTGWNVSTTVTSDKPVVAERAMYGIGRTWDHDYIGHAPE